MTVYDLIYEAAVMAGSTSVGDGTMPPEEQSYGWRKLADLIDLLKTNRLAIYREQRVGPFTVTAGQGDITAAAPITIGPGATWDTPRPIWIDRAGLIYTAGSTPRPELRMHIFNTKEWSQVAVKGITSTLSQGLYYDRNFTSLGYGNIYLYPVPSASFQVVLYLPVAMDEFPLDANGNPDFTTVIALPPGYRAMLISNLAKILCIGLLPISEDLREQARDTLADIKSANVVTMMDPLSCDRAVLSSGLDLQSGWDWLSGGFEN